jgi:hypothetical protein
MLSNERPLARAVSVVEVTDKDVYVFGMKNCVLNV